MNKNYRNSLNTNNNREISSLNHSNTNKNIN